MKFLATLLISVTAGFLAIAQSVPSSIAHFRAGEAFLKQHNFQQAAAEFSQATSGDHQPAWTLVWSHLDLGRTFDATGQRERAVREYQLALETSDNTFAASDLAKAYLALAPGIDDPLPLPGRADYLVGATVRSRTEPDYSAEALLAGLQGDVVVAVSVDRTGSIADLRVSGPLGLGLDEAAIASVRHWTFSPATMNDQPEPSVTQVPVHFRLPTVRAGWRATKVQFAQAGPLLLRANAFSPGKMSPGLDEEASIDAAIGRIPTASLSMQIDGSGTPQKVEVTAASLPEWGEDAMRTVREWRFKPGSPIAVTIDLAWYPR